MVGNDMAIEILTSDYDRKSRMLTLARARKGRKVDSQVGSTKTRVAWTIQANEELADWSPNYIDGQKNCERWTGDKVVTEDDSTE